MLGKWHLGHRLPEMLPTARGFGSYWGIPYSNDMRPVQLLEGTRVSEYPVVQATLTDRYTERALQFIEAHQREPFFLYFAHAMPHKPLACSEAFYKKSGHGLYADTMAQLDASVGAVLDKLRALGLDRRTLVIFTSDNGPWFGGSTGGLRGMKGATWEGGVRVPAIFWWRGHVPADRVSPVLGITMDLFATLSAAAGLPAAKRPLDGADLLPALIHGADPPHDVVFAQQGPELATVRDARWKLHVLPSRENRLQADRWIDPRGPDGVTILAPYEQFSPAAYPSVRAGDEARPMMLFDLAADPAEQHDVAAENPEVVARLKARFDASHAELSAAK